MKLSEQIAQTCCGVLANKQAMIAKAEEIEGHIEFFEDLIKAFKLRLMDIDDD
jgi:hypothetical protein